MLDTIKKALFGSVSEVQMLSEKGNLAIAEFEGQAIKEVRLGPDLPLHYKAKDSDQDCAACGRMIWAKRMVWTDKEHYHAGHCYRCTMAKGRVN